MPPVVTKPYMLLTTIPNFNVYSFRFERCSILHSLKKQSQKLFLNEEVQQRDKRLIYAEW